MRHKPQPFFAIRASSKAIFALLLSSMLSLMTTSAGAEETPASWQTGSATSPDGTLIGYLFSQPNGIGPFPVVIFLHGAPGGVGAEALRRYTTSSRWTRFLSEGFAVCIADYRGHPANDPFAVLKGEATAADDLAALLKQLSQRTALDSRRFAVIGQSLGGVVTLDAVARVKIAPICIVLTAPATYPFIGYRGGRGGKRDRDLNDTDIDRPGTLARIEKVNLPVLILQGTDDQTDLFALNKKLFEVMKAAGKDVRLELFEGAGHPFTLGPEGDNYQRALEVTVAFVKKHLMAPPALSPTPPSA